MANEDSEFRRSEWATESRATLFSPLALFIAARSALEDLEDDTARRLRPRVGAIVVYASVPGPPAQESELGASICAVIVDLLVAGGATPLAISRLPRGSFGAVIFAETPESHDRQGMFGVFGDYGVSNWP